ncbi:hypothetical protein BJY27_007857 [Streptomyces rapamycinicus]|uniref:Uncharacterized protein n=1 Tax=Streptomyces rapamycinicus TaxID=1226757 RepID=A0ABR6LX18_9ACTN|nr:hypothetical protein [Streptomyces rapamycinicus]
MLLRLAYLGVANAFAMLRLLPMSDRDKDAEILALRHQVTVLERQLGKERVRFAPSDRAFLAVLLHRLPLHVLRRLRLLVRPGTVLRWHRTLVARLKGVNIPIRLLSWVSPAEGKAAGVASGVSSGVVVLGVLVEDRPQVSFTGDEESVGALGPGGAYPSFRVGVGPRALWRSRDDGCAVAGEDGVECGGELAVPVPDEEPEAPRSVVEVHEQVAGELGDPCAGRVAGDAQNMDAQGGDLYDEEDIETPEEDGLHMHEVTGEQRVGLGAQKGTPGLLGGALRCGW